MKAIPRRDFAKLLRGVRRVLGMTQYQLAQKLRTGAGTVSRWENEHSAPPPIGRVGIVETLCELLFEKLENP